MKTSLISVVLLSLMLVVGGTMSTTAEADNPVEELEALLVEEELKEVAIEDQEQNLDRRGRNYVRNAQRLEAEIAADRELRQRKKRILKFRTTLATGLEEIEQEIAKSKSIGIENIRPQSRAGIRQRARENREKRLTRRQPIKVKEFVAIEAGNILRMLQQDDYKIANFSNERSRNQSATMLNSSVSNPFRDDIENEATRIMRELLRNGDHENRVHPGAEMRRASARE